MTTRKLLIVEVLSRGSAFHYRYDVFRSNGYKLYYLTTSQEVAYAFDGLRRVPARALEQFREAALDWHRREGFDAIITTDEASVIATAILAQELGLPGLPVEAARCSRNKLFMRQAHKAHGAPHPQFRRCDTAEEALQFALEVGFPVVVKPTLGADSEHVYRADDPQQLARRFAEAIEGNNKHSHRYAEAECDEMGPHALLVESFLDGPEYCVEAVIDGADIFVGSIADRLSVELDVFDNDLYCTPTRLDAQQQAAVADAVQRGAKAQGIERGVVHAELRFHEGKPYIVEIAARPGGGSLQYMAKISYDYCSVSAALRAVETMRMPTPELRPTGKVAVGLTMLCAEGRLQDVRIPEGLVERHEIFNLVVLPRKGGVIRRPPNGNDIFAYVGARGDSLEHALENAAAVAAGIEVHLSPA
jgi:biotin carboxylase